MTWLLKNFRAITLETEEESSRARWEEPERILRSRFAVMFKDARRGRYFAAPLHRARLRGPEHLEVTTRLSHA